MSEQSQPHPELQLYRTFYNQVEAQDLLSCLQQEVNWQADFFMAFGRRIDIPRLQAWYADPGVCYRYSDNLLPQQDWHPLLLAIKHKVEAALQQHFNSVLLTYYRDGHDSVDWHADDEQELGPQPWIASLSLGASRLFQYRHKPDDDTGETELHHGDLILMRPGFQHHWQHRVPPQYEIIEPRINLTFRQVTQSV